MAFYLVTGGCGFIGSHLVDALLAAGHEVRILDDLSSGKRSNVPASVEIMEGDVVDPATVVTAMTGVDGCFHLAAIASVQRSNEEWLRSHQVNLTGAINVFDAARFANDRGAVPVVYASSAAVYGDNTAVPLAESAEKMPLTAYGADKLGCEQHARVAGNVHGVPTIGLRFFNIYGPRQDPDSPYSGVISIFADRLRSGRPATVFGDGGQMRDFVYVGDCVRFVMAAMQHAGTGAAVYNVCTGRPTTLLALVDALGDSAGKKLAVEYGPPRVGDIRRSYGVATKIERAFGLRAQTPLREGLTATLASLGP